MSYITSGQTHQIEMMYGGHPHRESFQEMLQTFGQLVESKVLPAEKKTEMERAQDSLKSLAFQLRQSGKYDQQALETAIAQTKKNEKIPDAVYRQIADFGLPGMAFSEPLGGSEIPYPVFMACLETLGKASPSVGVRYAISNTVAEGLRFNYEAGQLSGYGESILRELIAGEKLGGFALTEGSAAGSNILKEMITRAVPLQKARRCLSPMWRRRTFSRYSPGPPNRPGMISAFLYSWLKKVLKDSRSGRCLRKGRSKTHPWGN